MGKLGRWAFSSSGGLGLPNPALARMISLVTELRSAGSFNCVNQPSMGPWAHGRVALDGKALVAHDPDSLSVNG